MAYVFVCLCCFYYCVFHYFAIVVIVSVKIPPLLVERVGGECCDRTFCCGYFDAVFEASADVFYVFMPHGDDVRCLIRKHHLGEKFDGVVGGGVGVVKRRQLGGYRGSAVARWFWEADRISSSYGSSSSTSCEGASSAVSSNWRLGV